MKTMVLASVMSVALFVGGCASESEPQPTPAPAPTAASNEPPAPAEGEIDFRRIKVYGGNDGYCAEAYGMVICCSGSPSSPGGEYCVGP